MTTWTLGALRAAQLDVVLDSSACTTSFDGLSCPIGAFPIRRQLESAGQLHDAVSGAGTAVVHIPADAEVVVSDLREALAFAWKKTDLVRV